MKEKRSICVILFLCVVIFDSLLIYHLKQESGELIRFDEPAMMQTLRNQQIPLEITAQLKEYSDSGGNYSLAEYMFGYLYTGLTDERELNNILAKFAKRYPEALKRYAGYEEAIWSELQVFPVPTSEIHPETVVSFEDSWMQSRTFGGNRGHEGCDVMASLNVRGHYPIVSVSDGVVEKIGWLSQGGYRIGVRSTKGAYFYYAHLYDYAREFELGETVHAGELLGFMGDSGYSEIEGTVGNFDVHLHFGIYLNDENGEEFSVNSYWILKSLETKKNSCIF